MAKVNITLTPWNGDRRVNLGDQTALGVEPGTGLKINGQTVDCSRWELIVDSDQFFLTVVLYDVAEAYFASFDIADQILGSDRKRLELPVDHVEIDYARDV